MFFVLQMSQGEPQENPQPQRPPRAARAARGGGRALRAGGRGMQMAGRGMRMAGRGMQTAGQGAQAGGRAMMGAGAALSGTGVGALAGVPLAAAGAGVTAAGAGAQAGGAGVQAAGGAAETGGRAAAGAGAKMEQAAQLAEAAAKSAQPGGEIADQITATLKRFPLLSIINDAFPVLFWIITYLIRSFSFLVLIIGLLALPLLWALICWLALFGKYFKLPLMPVKLPQCKIFELVVSSIVAIFAVSIPTMIILMTLCSTPGGWLTRQGAKVFYDISIDCDKFNL